MWLDISMSNSVNPQEPGKVTGYRNVPQASLDLVNKLKAKEQELAELHTEVHNYILDNVLREESLDPGFDIGESLEYLANGKANLIQGFMWTVRGLMLPKSGW